jgi:hypothetical protein
MSQPTLVLLLGGPSGTPRLWEIQPGGDSDRVKILQGNAYEHFEFADEYAEFGGELIPVCRWSYRTFVAE